MATTAMSAAALPGWVWAESAPSTAQSVEIRADLPIARVRPELHGQFAEHLGSCVYGGLWVGAESPISNIHGYRKQAIEWLSELGVPVLRWPGGCFADDYHWRDGIGPQKDRPRTVNANWGNVIDDNSFGTHEFIGLCRLLGAEPYLAGNVGSASPEEMRDWVEYCNFPGGSTVSDLRAKNGSKEPFNVRYWGVGNESWGCGGSMQPQYYGELYRRYSTFLRDMGGPELFLIASGPSGDDVRWTRGLLDVCQTHMPNGLSLHYYEGGPVEATHFTAEQAMAQFAIFGKVEEAIVHQREVIDGYYHGNETALILDEWGVWDAINPADEKKYGKLWQQSTMRSAVAAGLGLNMFNRLADKLYMCNIAQIMNVLQSMLLTDGPESEHCVRTSTYYAFLLFKAHRGNLAVRTQVADTSEQAISASASRGEKELVVSLVNPSPSKAVTADCLLRDFAAKRVSAQMLHSDDLNAYNGFDEPDRLHPVACMPKLEKNHLVVELPPLSIVTARVELA